MVSLIDINNDIKNIPVGIKIVTLVTYWYGIGTLKVRESLYTSIIIWVNDILNHIEIRIISPKYKDLYMLCRP